MKFFGSFRAFFFKKNPLSVGPPTNRLSFFHFQFFRREPFRPWFFSPFRLIFLCSRIFQKCCFHSITVSTYFSNWQFWLFSFLQSLIFLDFSFFPGGFLSFRNPERNKFLFFYLRFLASFFRFGTLRSSFLPSLEISQLIFSLTFFIFHQSTSKKFAWASILDWFFLSKTLLKSEFRPVFFVFVKHKIHP